MVQSVELLLDPALDAVVREQWQALAAVGLPSQARHPGASNAPHITMAVSDTALATTVEDALPAAVTLPIPIRLGGLLLFGAGPYVLVRSVVPSRLLLEVHEAVAGVLPGPAAMPHTRPEQWTPHMTLAHQLPRSDVAEALAALASFPDAAGAAVAARRWDSEQRLAWLIGAAQTS